MWIMQSGHAITDDGYLWYGLSRCQAYIPTYCTYNMYLLTIGLATYHVIYPARSAYQPTIPVHARDADVVNSWAYWLTLHLKLSGVPGYIV